MTAYCLLAVFLPATQVVDADQAAEAFRRIADGVVWSNPAERDHQEAIGLIRQLQRMGPSGQRQIERTVAPALAAALAAQAERASWSDPTEKDHAAVRNLVGLLGALQPAADAAIAEAAAPPLVQHFRARVRSANWSDPTEKDHASARYLLECLNGLGSAAELAIRQSVAPALGEAFAAHAVRRNPDWGNPRERDYAAAKNTAELLHSLGPAAYPTLEATVLPVLEGQRAAAARALADQVARAGFDVIVTGIDFPRRQIEVQDRHGNRGRLTVDSAAVVEPGALEVGRAVYVSFDLRTRVADRIRRSRL